MTGFTLNDSYWEQKQFFHDANMHKIAEVKGSEGMAEDRVAREGGKKYEM